ncbi:MAG: hypothetical protein FJ029_11965, partial [Actinobacteria bacterium]|nr:hypothetical protein [Actinomycetota bacterium]
MDNTLDMYLHHSRDGLHWQRFTEHRPFVPRGAPGAYDSVDLETPNQPFEVGDELWFYYGGMRVHHDWWIYGQQQGLDVPEASDPGLAQNGHHLCLATLRRDGYVSLDATVREGYVETKPLFSTAPHLFLNARCGRGGYVRVEAMDIWNNVWSGFGGADAVTFTGDSVRHRGAWTGGDR